VPVPKFVDLPFIHDVAAYSGETEGVVGRVYAGIHAAQIHDAQARRVRPVPNPDEQEAIDRAIRLQQRLNSTISLNAPPGGPIVYEGDPVLSLHDMVAPVGSYSDPAAMVVTAEWAYAILQRLHQSVAMLEMILPQPVSLSPDAE